MKIIEIYIAKKILTIFLAFLLIILTIGWSIEILGKINFVTINGKNLLDFLYFSCMFIPSTLALITPFAQAFTCAYILQNLNQDNELIIIANAAGSRLYIWRPFIMLAAICSIMLFLLSNFIVPAARIKMRYIMADSSANFISNALAENCFLALKDKLYIKIGKKHTSYQLEDIFISDERKLKTQTYYFAKQAEIINNTEHCVLSMHDGSILQHKANGENSIIKFELYNFDLLNLLPHSKILTILPKDLYLTDLWNNRNKSGYLSELHFRITTWLNPLIFTLILLILCGYPQPIRAKNISPLLIAGLCSFSYHIINYSLKAKIEQNIICLYGLYLLPLGVILCFIFYVLSKDPPNILDKCIFLGENYKSLFKKYIL